MSVLTKEQILGKKDVEIQKVFVPEWDGDVGIKKMTGEERDSFEFSMSKRSKNKPKGEMDTIGIKAELLSICIVDEEGNRLFEASDIPALNKKSGLVIDKLFDAARTLNRLGEGDVKELEKNSGSDTSAGIGSDLQDK